MQSRCDIIYGFIRLDTCLVSALDGVSEGRFEVLHTGWVTDSCNKRKQDIKLHVLNKTLKYVAEKEDNYKFSC